MHIFTIRGPQAIYQIYLSHYPVLRCSFRRISKTYRAFVYMGKRKNGIMRDTATIETDTTVPNSLTNSLFQQKSFF